MADPEYLIKTVLTMVRERKNENDKQNCPTYAWSPNASHQHQVNIVRKGLERDDSWWLIFFYPQGCCLNKDFLSQCVLLNLILFLVCTSD